MPRGKLETVQDCEDFLHGLLFFGTGGGGCEAWGMEMLQALLDDGLDIEWVDVEDIADDALTCTVYGTGSISEDVPDTEEEIEALAKKIGLENKHGHRVSEVAIRELGSYIGQDIAAIVPVELGAGNAPAPLITGIRMGIPVVDGDYGGRAYPEEMQSTLFLKDIPPFPLSAVDWWGNVLILKEACSSVMMERIGKMLSTAAYGGTFLAASVMDGRKMKETVIPGTFSRSLAVGRAIRQARDCGEDVIAAAVIASEGWLMFTGCVKKMEWEDQEGCMIGSTWVEGTGPYAGQELRIWFKNENQISWLNGKPFVCSPDLITILNSETGIAYINSDIAAGQNVAVIGVRCADIFRSKRGLEWSGPAYFGFPEIEYQPVETILDRRIDS